jgi:hypothetical protein
MYLFVSVLQLEVSPKAYADSLIKMLSKLLAMLVDSSQ